MPVKLSLVKQAGDVQAGLETFNRDVQQRLKLARSLLNGTKLWVHSPSTRAFGPNKFVAFQNMNFADYARARDGDWQGARFNGTVAREAVERVLGPYTQDTPDTGLTAELVR